jgi:hypothetical protein
MNRLDQISTVDLVDSASLEDMAAREGWAPGEYAIGLAEEIRPTYFPLDRQRERLAQLAQVGAGLAGDAVTAEALMEHYAILEAIWHRLAREAVLALSSGDKRAGEHSERFLSGALKAQRACMAVLSAVKVLRDGQAVQAQPPAVAGTAT